MMKVLIVCGTRPEVIKVAPVIKEFKKFPKEFVCKVCITGQHREMIDPLLKLFDIRADYDLNLMKANQDLEHITTTVLHEIGKIIDQEHLITCSSRGHDNAKAMSLAALQAREGRPYRSGPADLEQISSATGRGQPQDHRQRQRSLFRAHGRGFQTESSERRG